LPLQSLFPGEYLSDDLAIGLPTDRTIKIRTVPKRLPISDSGNSPADKQVESIPDGLHQNSGLTVSINIDEEIIKNAIFDAVHEATINQYSNHSIKENSDK